MLEVIKVTLQGVGYSIFNLSFIFGVWLIYVIIRKLNTLDFYRSVPKKPYMYLISDILLQGIIAGIVVSLVMVVVGIPLYFNGMYLMIIPLALILSIYRLRFVCISYPMAVLAFLSLIFNGQQVFGLTLPSVEIHIPSAMILVGLLHLIEGLLVFFDGAKRAVPIISKVDDKVVMGHIIQKVWIIPLSIIVLQLGNAGAGGIQMPEWWPAMSYTGYGQAIFFSLFPFLGFAGYSTLVYSETPKSRARFSGALIAVFGVILITVGRMSLNIWLLQVIGAFLMVGLHEGIYYIEKAREKTKAALYTVPEEGVRIMQVLEGGYAQHLGIKKGDIIEVIGQDKINNITQFARLIKSKKDHVNITVVDIHGKEHQHMVMDSRHLEHLGIRILPEKPLFLYPYNQFGYMGMMEFIKKAD